MRPCKQNTAALATLLKKSLSKLALEYYKREKNCEILMLDILLKENGI